MNLNSYIIGYIIKETRKERKISQYDLACSLNIGQKSLADIELGKKKANVELFFNILSKMGVTEFSIKDNHVELAFDKEVLK